MGASPLSARQGAAIPLPHVCCLATSSLERRRFVPGLFALGDVSLSSQLSKAAPTVWARDPRLQIKKTRKSVHRDGPAPYDHSDTPSVIKDNLKKLEKWKVKQLSLPVTQGNEDFDQKHCDGGLISEEH